ncbi:glycosyltransferase family 25 protein [Alteromonas facilis]|uniref:glycosyltransferase family 25 protein n=1 Tax=Alteromonas facilis TaxID=2048004 RepID=UPI000C293360|nr:glycosyltransferase family 25 protein [Alteromonas facilis]
MTQRPPCFVINLARSTERLDVIQQQFSALNLSFERVNAVDGKDLTSQQLNAVYAPQHPDAYYKTLNMGEIACYLSHRAIWQRIVDEHIPFAIILEDDVHLHSSLPQSISAIEQMPEDWDYIKLAQHVRKRPTVHQHRFGDYTRVTYAKVPARTCAQAVSYAGAKKLLEHSLPIIRPIDIDLQYWWEKDLRIFGLMPYPAEPNVQQSSDIEVIAQRKKAVKSLTRKLSNMWQFYWLNRLHTKRRLASLNQDIQG